MCDRLMSLLMSPFSAVVKFQKQFADDLVENVRKNRERFDKHHREMKKRYLEKHLDELEERYLCCVCGKRGESRDFEPPIALRRAAEVVDPNGAKERFIKAAIDGTKSERLKKQHETSEVREGEEPVTAEEHRPEDYVTSTEEQPAQAVMNPSDVRNLVVQTERDIIAANKLKRLEEKYKKYGSYHKDKGLVRVHDSDVDAFSSFFKKPVRGYLCTDCHSSAKRRLDILTSQIRTILAKAQVPFTRLSSAVNTATDVDKANASQATQSGNADVLSDETIALLRTLARCSVCRRRQATFFLRANVLFLCQFCTARDQFYREHAICINDEPMELSGKHLLDRIAAHLRSQSAPDVQKSRAALEIEQKKRVQPMTLFESEIDLFKVAAWTRVPQESLRAPQQQLNSSSTCDACEGVVPSSDIAVPLEVVPDFTELECEVHGSLAANSNRNLRQRARKTCVSLFESKNLQTAIDLWAIPFENRNSVASTDALSLFDGQDGTKFADGGPSHGPQGSGGATSSATVQRCIPPDQSTLAPQECHRVRDGPTEGGETSTCDPTKALSSAPSETSRAHAGVALSEKS